MTGQPSEGREAAVCANHNHTMPCGCMLCLDCMCMDQPAPTAPPPAAPPEHVCGKQGFQRGGLEALNDVCPACAPVTEIRSMSESAASFFACEEERNSSRSTAYMQEISAAAPSEAREEEVYGTAAEWKRAWEADTASLRARLTTAEAARKEDDRAADLSNCLAVLCRAVDDGADAGWQEFLAWYTPGQWLSPYRALGAFLRARLDRQRATAEAERDQWRARAKYLLSEGPDGVPAYIATPDGCAYHTIGVPGVYPSAWAAIDAAIRATLSPEPT